jgi:integrase
MAKSIAFHDLRHTASLLMMAGASPAAVQRILRHRDPRITMEVYGHLTPGYQRLHKAAFGRSDGPYVPPYVAPGHVAATHEANSP